jgi:hypothetical protein
MFPLVLTGLPFKDLLPIPVKIRYNRIAGQEYQSVSGIYAVAAYI